MNEETIITPPHQSRFYITFSEYRMPDQKTDTWSYTKVEIFDKEQGDQKIGEYIRNYRSNPELTFFPFKTSNGKWYALYSEVYHRTFVMSLPDCKKIAECNTHRPNSTFDTSGFCPVNYWVPSVWEWEMQWDKNTFPEKPEKEFFWADIEEEGDMFNEYNKHNWCHLDFGFVYGCYWGGEFYIQKIDLSKIEDGLVDISCPFDPCELPSKIKKFDEVISIHIHDTKPCAYGVSVLGKFYRFQDNTNNILT